MMWASPPTPELPQANEAALALRDGHFEEAVRLYQSLCLRFPADAALHLSLAAALHSAGQYPEALRELQRIEPAERQNGKYWFLLGVTEAKLGDPAKAIVPLTRAVDLEPANTEARLEAASTLLEVHRFAAAETQYRLLAAKLPQSPKVWEGLALSETGLSRQALEDLKKAAPHSSYLCGLAALAAAQSGDTVRAVDLYQKALASSPDAGWLRSELAALRSGPPPQACRDLSYACRVLRGDVQGVANEVANLHTPEALYWTTRLHAQLARDSVQTLAGLPPSSELHQVMALLYTQSGRRADAIAELRQAVRLSPGDAPAAADLAEALWADRQYEECLALLAPLTSSHPRRGDWQFEMGDALFNLGRSEEALVHLNEAVKLSPALLPAQAKLGEALLRMGDAAAALPHLELAQPLDRDGSIHFQLAAAYRKLGNTQAASQALQRQRELANTARGTLPQSPGTQ